VSEFFDDIEDLNGFNIIIKIEKFALVEEIDDCMEGDK